MNENTINENQFTRQRFLERRVRSYLCNCAQVEARSKYTSSFLVDASIILDELKKKVNLLEKNSKTSNQVHEQKIKHLLSKNIVHPKIKKHFSSLTAAGTAFNYSYIRDSIGKALNLKDSQLNISDLSYNNFISQVANSATMADAATLLIFAVGLTTAWYYGKKFDRNLHRKFAEENLALYGDKDENLGINKGEVNKAIDYFSMIPLHQTLSNITNSWGNKAQSFTKALIQNTLLTIHKFKENKLYKFLSNFISEESMNKLREGTLNRVNEIEKNIKRINKRGFYFKSVYERQVEKLQELEKHKEDLKPNQTYKKRMNDDIENINEKTYSNMLKRGIFQSVERATREIYFSSYTKEVDKIEKALEVLHGIASLSEVVSSDGVNRYTIISRTADKILTEYKTLKFEPKNKKDVSNRIREIFRRELFKYGKSEMEELKNKSENKIVSDENKFLLYSKILEMQFVKAKSYKRVLNEQISEFINNEKTVSFASKLGKFRSFDEVLNYTVSPVINESLERKMILKSKINNLNKLKAKQKQMVDTLTVDESTFEHIGYEVNKKTENKIKIN